jgi:hypothetical protein
VFGLSNVHGWGRRGGGPERSAEADACSEEQDGGHRRHLRVPADRGEQRGAAVAARCSGELFGELIVTPQLPTFAVGGLPVLELVLQLSAGASSDDP